MAARPAEGARLGRSLAEGGGAELDAKRTAVAALAGAVRRGRVTLLFAAQDPEHNNAVALQAYLAERRRA